MNDLSAHCPHCLSQNLHVIEEEDFGSKGTIKTYFVQCYECGSRGPRKMDKNSAIVAYNILKISSSNRMFLELKKIIFELVKLYKIKEDEIYFINWERGERKKRIRLRSLSRMRVEKVLKYSEKLKLR